MPTYHVRCYPNWEYWDETVEADSIEEAIEIAEDYANQNCCFIATPEDVEVEEQ